MEQIEQNLKPDFKSVFGKNMKGKDIQIHLLKFHPDKVHSVDFSCFYSIAHLKFTLQEKTEICTIITRFLLSAKNTSNGTTENTTNVSNETEHCFKDETVYGWSDYEFVINSRIMEYYHLWWTCPNCAGQTNQEFTKCQNDDCDFDIKIAEKNYKGKKYFSDEVKQNYKTEHFRNYLKRNGEHFSEMNEDELGNYYLENKKEFDMYVRKKVNKANKAFKQIQNNTQKIQFNQEIFQTHHIPIISNDSESVW